MREQVLAYMYRWIAILRLGDEWEFELKLTPNLEDLGFTRADPRYGKAEVSLRDPSDGSHTDWRRTVIHELLHVRIPISAPAESPLCSVIEHSVEVLARILFRMDSSGADSGSMFRQAHAWARTIKTARVGKRTDMGNAKRAMEIMVALATMKVPEEAMTLITELAGFAVDDSGEEPSDPMAAAATKQDPMLASDPGKAAEAMMRIALGDAGYKAYRANIALAANMATENARAGVLTMARRELGDGAGKLTPEEEASLLKKSPHDAAQWLEGRRARPQQATAGMARQGDGLRAANTEDDAPILAPGEDAAKVRPEVLQMRAMQAQQFGRATVVAGLARRVP